MLVKISIIHYILTIIIVYYILTIINYSIALLHFRDPVEVHVGSDACQHTGMLGITTPSPADDADQTEHATLAFVHQRASGISLQTNVSIYIHVYNHTYNGLTV